MTCESCGEKPKNQSKDFTKAVVEIDNPEKLILFHKVVIPTSMGDDTVVVPAVGKYHNTLVYYEANNKSYLYSSDGIPTQLANGLTDYESATNLPQINGITLVGDKSANDLGLAPASQAIKELSSADYDYPNNNPSGVALWRLPDGIYHNPRAVNVYTFSAFSPSPFVTSSYWIKVSSSGGNATQIYGFDGGGEYIRYFWVNPTTGECTNTQNVFLKSSDCVDDLVSSIINRPLSAKQGKILNDKITDISTGLDYSTTEVDTKTKWIDGKTIYKKTINFGALPNNTDKSVSHSISNLSKVIKIEGYAYNSTYTLFSSIAAPTIRTFISDIEVEMTTSQDWSEFTECYITLYYTKSS